MVGMATEQRSSRRQQRGKTEALCRAGNIFSHKQRATETAVAERLPPFPRTHPHPPAQPEPADKNGPGNASLPSLYFRSLCCLSVHTVALLQQRADRWACCRLSVSRGHLTVTRRRRGPGMAIPHLSLPEAAWPRGSGCRPTSLLLQWTT